MSTHAAPQTLVDKIWRQHVIRELSDGRTLIHIDRHFLHNGTNRQAFDGLRRIKRPVRNLDLTWAVVDHILSTLPGRTGESHPPSIERIHALRDNCRQFNLKLFDTDDPQQGIAHVIAPELGITLPGCTLVCGDSHTATNGGLGALAWGIGTTEVMHVVATQSLLVRKQKQLRINFNGRIGAGVSSKDMILYFMSKHGVTAGAGCTVEYAGPAIRALPIEARMTICNMSIEAGGRAGMIAPDETTFEYLKGRPHAPQGADWDAAVAYWKTLVTDADATFDAEVDLDASTLTPFVTWGTNPGQGLPLSGSVPSLVLIQAIISRFRRTSNATRS